MSYSLSKNFTQVLKNLTLVILLLVTATATGCSGPEQDASKLYTDVKKLYSEGKELEKTSYSDALKKYVEASVKLDEISSRFPKSQKAADIASGAEKLDSMSPADFSDKFIPSVKFKADAENSPAACALLFIQDITNHSVKTSVIVNTALSYQLSGNPEKADLLFKQALETAQKQTSSWRFPPYLTELKPPIAKAAEGLCKAGKTAEAFKAAEKIMDPFYKSTGFVQIAVKLSEDKNSKDAVKAMKDACVAVEYEKDLTYRTFALLDIVRGFIKTGKLQEATGKLKEAEKLNGIQDSVSDKTLVFKDIAVIYYKMGKKAEAEKYLKQAQSLVEKEKDSPWKSFLHYIIAVNYAEIGLKDEAVKTALAIKDEIETNRALLMIFEKTGKDDVEAKGRIIKTALEQAEKIKDPATKAFCLANIAKTYTTEGLKDKALTLLAQAEKLADESIKNNKDKKTENRIKTAISKIEQVYVLTGKMENVEKAAQDRMKDKNITIRDSWMTEEWLIETALLLADNKEYDNAVKLTAILVDPASKAEVLASVALKMAENKVSPDEEMRKTLHVIAGSVK